MKLIDKIKVVVWNIGFINQGIDSFLSCIDEFEIEWMNHPYRDRFFADPFVLGMDDLYIFILAEEYLFREGKGRIVKLTVEKKTKKLCRNERIIDADYHLSYPFIFDESIIPEQNKSDHWYSYDFGGSKKAELAGIGLIDATILDDGCDQWVFATKIEGHKESALRKLYRYKMVNGVVDEKTELLIKDSFIASRPGGNFFCHNGEWYRPAQTSTTSVYGESIAICRIVNNTDSDYTEEVVRNVNSHAQKRFNLGMHTFNLAENIIVIDGFEMQAHPIYKVLYKIGHR